MKKLKTIGLLPFESEVLSYLLKRDSPLNTQIRAQLNGATVSHREFSDSGFFTYFDVPVDCERINPETFTSEHLHADIKNVANGAGFVLFVRDGHVSWLEGFTYEEEWPDDPVIVKIYPPRQPS